MTWIWEGSFMVEWHDMTAKWGVVRGERVLGEGEQSTANICMLTPQRQTHTNCIESHGLSAFGLPSCFCFISLTTFVAVVVFFGVFCAFLGSNSKVFRKPT